MRIVIFWDMTQLALVITDVSEELIASNIRMTIIGELGTIYFFAACFGY
jgi:hypothetical protein